MGQELPYPVGGKQTTSTQLLNWINFFQQSTETGVKNFHYAECKQSRGKEEPAHGIGSLTYKLQNEVRLQYFIDVSWDTFRT